MRVPICSCVVALDGEGSSSMYVPKQRKTPRRQIQVSHAGVAGTPPDVLVRFANIVGEGNITGPYRGYLFYWKTTQKAAIDRVASMLWPYLSAAKRSQFAAMTLAAGRSMPAMPPSRRAVVTETAWAAGLLDGEGSVVASGSARAPSIEVEISQASAGGIPDVLERFGRVVDCGSIYGPYGPRSAWSRLPQYRWSVTERHQVSDVMRTLRPWLSAPKRARVVSFAALLDPDFADMERTRTG
jgi:hypothetical protein